MTGLRLPARETASRTQQLLKRYAGSWVWKIVRTLFLIGISYIFLFPVLYMVSMAVRSPAAVNDPSSVWIPRELSLNSIRVAMSPQHLDYWASVGHTLVIAVCSTVGTLVSCSLAGYGFARFHFKEKNLMFVLVVATIIVPPQTLLLSSFVNYRHFDIFGLMKLLHAVIPAIPDHFNLINTPFTFILPSLFASGLRAGLFIFIFRQFFQGMPAELEEAARIDGCGTFGTFLRIIIPLARPAFVTVLLFSFIWHWNEYDLSVIFFSDNMPISVRLGGLRTLLSESSVFNSVTDTPDQIRTYLQAGALLTILPPLVLYVFTQRLFTESIERTGIVG